MNYLFRVTPPDPAASGAGIFDNPLEKCMRRILGGTLDSEVFKELQLQMKTINAQQLWTFTEITFFIAKEVCTG